MTSNIVCVWARARVCVCACIREKERERERESLVFFTNSKFPWTKWTGTETILMILHAIIRMWDKSFLRDETDVSWYGEKGLEKTFIVNLSQKISPTFTSTEFVFIKHIHTFTSNILFEQRRFGLGCPSLYQVKWLDKGWGNPDRNVVAQTILCCWWMCGFAWWLWFPSKSHRWNTIRLFPADCFKIEQDVSTCANSAWFSWLRTPMMHLSAHITLWEV